MDLRILSWGFDLTTEINADWLSQVIILTCSHEVAPLDISSNLRSALRHLSVTSSQPHGIFVVPEAFSSGIIIATVMDIVFYFSWCSASSFASSFLSHARTWFGWWWGVGIGVIRQWLLPRWVTQCLSPCGARWSTTTAPPPASSGASSASAASSSEAQGQGQGQKQGQENWIFQPRLTD